MRIANLNPYLKTYLKPYLNPYLNSQQHLSAGEAESSALVKEINKQKGIRPLTHDLTKNLLLAAGFKVLKIRITELVSPSVTDNMDTTEWRSTSKIACPCS